jgi:hypothetical protein
LTSFFYDIWNVLVTWTIIATAALSLSLFLVLMIYKNFKILNYFKVTRACLAWRCVLQQIVTINWVQKLTVWKVIKRLSLYSIMCAVDFYWSFTDLDLVSILTWCYLDFWLQLLNRLFCVDLLFREVLLKRNLNLCHAVDILRGYLTAYLGHLDLFFFTSQYVRRHKLDKLLIENVKHFVSYNAELVLFVG